MITRTGPGRYRHNAGDEYRINVRVEGTGKRIQVVLGDQPITLPKTVTPENYSPFGSLYSINALFTFSTDATDAARYTVTVVDANDTIIDTRVVRKPPGSQLSVFRQFDFRVV